jgi:hypothetical protein
MTFAYDWSGSLFATPQVILSRDPFRELQLQSIYARVPKGASGISLLRDRDNVFRSNTSFDTRRPGGGWSRL